MTAKSHGSLRGISDTTLFWDITKRCVVVLYLTFRDNLSVSSSRVKKSKKKVFLDFLVLEYGTYRLFHNLGTVLPFNAV
jgi:hypothetical protein